MSHFRPVGTLISTSADHRSFRRRVRDGPLLDDAHHAQSVNFGRSGSRAKAADYNHNGPVLYRPLAVPAQVDNYSLRVAGLIPKDKRKRQARPGCSGAPWPNRYHMYRRRQLPDRERGGERTSSGSKTRLGVQGGSRARSIAASGIIAHATSQALRSHHTLRPTRFWVLCTRVRGRDPQKCARTEFSGIQGTPGL